MASSIDLGVVRHHIGENGNWWLGKADTGYLAKGLPGAPATIKIGTVATGEPGTEASVFNSGTDSDAVFNFTIPKGEKGEKGDSGSPGADGKDGENGKDGADGKDGENGKDGADGKDGENGKDGANGVDGKDGENGKDGESAYEIAVRNGFNGTEAEWLTSISAANITAYTAWENWRDLDPSSNTLSYEEWISERLQAESSQSGFESPFSEDEIERMKAQLAWEAAEVGVEYWTGGYRNGKKIYGKIIDFGAGPVSTTKTLPHMISDLEEVVEMDTIWFISSTYTFNGMMSVISATLANNPNLSVNASNVLLQANGNLSTFTFKITLLYTCSDK